ncbi:MAG TPA: Gfo/Idh/MocA family oxidoreductase [Alloacidobacterium sp.]|nr:Gfo/Idh/MocA family oxidoreductase [Alloacidobacterium sp.]
MAAFGTTVAFKGPRRREAVRLALIGDGVQADVLRNCIDPNLARLVAICDIRPSTKSNADQRSGVSWFEDWRRLLHDQSIEAVMIATPPWLHGEIAIGSLAAGKHVLCEPPMATDARACEEMISVAQKNQRILHIGYQQQYDPSNWAAYRNIMKQGLLGDVYTVEATHHTNSSARLESPSSDAKFDPRPWGYSSLEHLLNWRLYQQYSSGPMGDEGGSIVSTINWFLDAVPTSVQAMGGIYSYKDGRDVDDHVYATLDYPNARTAMLSVIQSNGFEGSYIQILGTKGTLILGNGESLLFMEERNGVTSVSTAAVSGSQPVLDASATRRAEGADHSALAQGAAATGGVREAFQNEIAAFCGAIRTGAPLRCSLSDARNVVLTCLAINKALKSQERVRPQEFA